MGKINKNNLRVIIYWMNHIWNLRAGYLSNKNWSSICSDSTGTKLAACTDIDSIYTSSDSGVTWAVSSSGSKEWTSICSNSDGSKLAAVELNIWTNTNYGAGTWTQQATSLGTKNWKSICSDSTGTKLAACVYREFIYSSSDSGVNWNTEISSVSSSNMKKSLPNLWVSICSDTTGSKLAAAQYGDFIFTGTLIEYNVTMYGKTNSLANIFDPGTTSTDSNFKQNDTDLKSLFAPYSSGYKAYFTQDFLTNGVTLIPSSFPFTSAGTGLIPTYNLNPYFFFTVISNTIFTTARTGYNYGFKFTLNNSKIKFNTDTVVDVWMVGGGGGGGCNSGGSASDGAGGGGAGGVVNFKFPMQNGTTYTFTIGAGGAGKIGRSNDKGQDGFPTKMSWSSYSIDVSGGGGGAGGYVKAGIGGSGGGACVYNGSGTGANTSGGIADKKIKVTGGPIQYNYSKIISGPGTNNVPAIGSFSSATFTNNDTTNNISPIFLNYYANRGGNWTSGNNGGLGGGGAFAAGGDINSGTGISNGGDGITITGTIVVGGGGGGGASNGVTTIATGGSGGGGDGGNSTTAAKSGTANTGGGGGGGCDFTTTSALNSGGNGGSGVVYLFF